MLTGGDLILFPPVFFQLTVNGHSGAVGLVVRLSVVHLNTQIEPDRAQIPHQRELEKIAQETTKRSRNVPSCSVPVSCVLICLLIYRNASNKSPVAYFIF